MGVDLSNLVTAQEIELSSLKGKKIAIDALNTIYQFLSIIRQPDGTPLMDSQGRVTSHLSGLFYRTANLLELGIFPCYVFDGKPPKLKEKTVEERKALRSEATIMWEKSKEEGDLEAARLYAQRSSKVTPEMLEESKQLLSALGIPYVQAPSEGEAQAAYMCQREEVYAVGSQDFDALLFGATRLIRNLNITGKRKVPRKNEYIEIKPELIELSAVLKELEIKPEQFIEIGILVGTDFNPGLKGIGPKKALKHVKEKTIQQLAKEFDFGVDIFQVKKIFLEPELTKNYTLEWKEPDAEKLIKILHEEHSFSKERIENTLKKLEEAKKEKTQRSLERWLK